MPVTRTFQSQHARQPETAASLLVASTDDFLVNTLTAQDQFDPQVIALAGGGYAVVWGSGSASQNSPIELRAQVLDANGDKVGAEILIDDSTDGARALRLDALAGGGFVVVWDDARPGDGPGGGTNGAFGIRAQVVSDAGVKVGTEISVNTAIIGAQISPEVAALTDGRFVIVWSDQSAEVKGRIFEADGTPAGGEFIVNATNAYEQSVPEIAALPDGGFVVAWQDYSAAGPPSQFHSNDTQVDVRAQYFDSLGDRVGFELLVNTTTTARQDPKEIIALDNGNVAIVWHDWSTGQLDLRGQLFDSAGARLGPEFLVNTTIQGGQSSPRSVALPGGAFVVSWFSSDTDTQRAQVFAADGSKIGGEIDAGANATYGTPSIARLPGDEFAISWVKGNSLGTTDVWMQVFGADGTRHGDAFIVHQETEGQQVWSGLAAGTDGRLLAIWRDGTPMATDPFHVGTDVKARLFGPPTSQSGTESDDVLTGTPVNDVLDGRGGDDSLSGLAGSDVLVGGTGDDSLSGLGGDDVLVGGTGEDAMAGGAGDDTYYVDSAGDVVAEAAGEGNDRIAASVSYRLASGAEVETIEAITLGDTTALNFAGNEFANRVIGNNGGNVLEGGAGNDQLEGGGGSDALVGGAGFDLMYGGAGNDTFYVADSGDHAFELTGGGNDRVAAMVSYTLTAGSEVEVLEAITLSDTAAMNLTGNALGQSVIGNDGVNTIDGKGGSDILVGAGGADIFAFTTALGGTNVDTIADFSAADDTIALDDAVFTGLTPGALAASAFVIGSAAGDADDRIVYNNATGALYFDADGSGAGAMVQFATLHGAPAITASDFTVI